MLGGDATLDECVRGVTVVASKAVWSEVGETNPLKVTKYRAFGPERAVAPAYLIVLQ